MSMDPNATVTPVMMNRRNGREVDPYPVGGLTIRAHMALELAKAMIQRPVCHLSTVPEEAVRMADLLIENLS